MNAAAHAGMVALEGGEFLMGSARFYPEERPPRMVRVASFRIDETPVTNRAFAAFVEATGHVTIAETAAPGVPHAGSSVFQPTAGPVNLADPSQWWAFVEGACWRRPLGPGSDIDTLAEHPVVHIAHADAQAYAR
jgi:formylglycine-generating enzyme